MRRILRRRGLQGAIGLIAAYVFALQGLFAPGAAAHATVAAADGLAVICFSHPESQPTSPTDVPGRADGCCVICTIHASAALPGGSPPSLILPATEGSKLGIVALTRATWPAPMRGGLARAPPRLA